MLNNKNTKLLVMPVTARWRIVGWILLTTALIILTVILTARSIFQGQIRHNANEAIIQEIHEFRTFATEAVDSKTHRRFTSLTALMERYLERQTPDWGEAFIGITPTDVMFVDNASKDAGERLAGDRERLNMLLNSKANSGVLDTPDGELRWGKSTIEARGETAVLLVTEFVQGRLNLVRRNMMILFGIMLAGLLLAAVIAWVVAGQILAPITRFAELSSRVGPLDLDTRLPEDGRDELSDLARSINEMLDRISLAQADQRHVLAETLRQIQHTTSALSQWRAGESPDPATMNQTMRELRQLQDDLALLLASGDPDFLQIRDVDLGALTYQLTQSIRRAFPAHSWQVTKTGEGHLGLDARRILQGMHHLAAHTVSVTPESQTIELGTGVKNLPTGEKMASFWIAAPDMVLTADQAQAIFDTPAEPAGDWLLASSRGLADGLTDVLQPDDAPAITHGIGPAVVKALAHAHGGYAWIKSSPDEGTVLGIDIPFKLSSALRPADKAGEEALDVMSQEKS
ncbi:MAG: HAMP domain-containing protein [Lautropia sp.]|nr:HAMP domain-containing protein [Lautropia sp.]